MESLLAWVLFPLLVYVVAVGLGLLVGRIVRAPLPAGLLAPVGLCAAVVTALPAYKLGASVWVGAPLLALLALAGWLLERRDLSRERLLPGWPLAAALATYALFMAPVVLSGHWTWLGYNFVNDTAVNLLMTDHVAEQGVTMPDGPDSTTTWVVGGTLDSRYPMGLHALLASLHGLVGFLPLEAVNQPFIAMLAALAAMAFTFLAGRLGVAGPLAAALGLVAAGANLTYQYAAHGAFKEVAVVLVIAAGAALCRVALDERLPLGVVAQLGIVFAAGLVIFSTAAVAYAGVFALVLTAAVVASPWRPPPVTLGKAAGVGAAVMVLAALPGLADAIAFGSTASEYYAAEGGLEGQNAVAFLGHLIRPLPIYEAVGFWPNQDYRVPLSGVQSTVSGAYIVLTVALLLVTAVAELRGRRLGALLALVPALVVWVVASSRLGPYAEAKLLVLLAPAVVFAAGMGAWHVGRRVPVAGALLGAVVAGAVLMSDALAYHGVRLAPVERLEALRAAAERAGPDELVLAPEWEEWTKYFAADRRVNVAPESFSPRPVKLRQEFSYFAHSIDLDLMELSYVQRFPAILLRRSPDASRPPANYGLAYRNRFYELWRREPGREVLEHMPLQQLHQASVSPSCPELLAMAERAPAGTELVGARREPPALFDFPRRVTAGWVPTYMPGVVVPTQPGDPSGRVALKEGRYRVWLRGSTGRRLSVFLDGRRVGRVKGVNTPEQWLPAGEVQVGDGVHAVRLLRPGGSLAPGDGNPGELGPVAFEPTDEVGGLVTAAPAAAESAFCGQPWDWIEVVRP